MVSRLVDVTLVRTLRRDDYRHAYLLSMYALLATHSLAEPEGPRRRQSAPLTEFMTVAHPKKEGAIAKRLANLDPCARNPHAGSVQSSEAFGDRGGGVSHL